VLMGLSCMASAGPLGADPAQGGEAVEVDDGRHFHNRLDCSVEPHGWREKLDGVLPEAEEEIRTARHAGPAIYTGEGGVAFTLLHLAAQRAAHSPPRELAAEALRRLRAGERNFSSRRVTLLEGAPGSLALQAWAHRQRNEARETAACVERLEAFAPRAAGLEPGECEVLYGRCGFLGAVLFVRQKLGAANLLAEPAARIVRQVLAAGRAQACGAWPLYYEWHGKCYFGGAHGIAGILLTLLQMPVELAQADGEAASLVRATAEVLLARRFESGNLPSSEGSARDKCVQWCHGAPGLVPLLLKMAEVYEEPRYLQLAREAGETVWARGLLSTKGLGLCHGIPGNGYALLALHRATGEGAWLRRAQHFAAFAAERRQELTPLADRPHSLFEGLAGAICFWEDTIRASGAPDSEAVLFPCYEFFAAAPP